MFAQTDGPTALRRDLVHALSVAESEAWVELEPGAPPVRAVAAVGGVWNGRKGYVAVLMRVLDPPLIHRFTYKDPLDTLDDLSRAVNAAIELVQDYGFRMDASAFRALPEAQQVHRMRVWDAIRKLVQDPLQGRPPDADSSSGRPPAPATADDPEAPAPRVSATDDAGRVQRATADVRSGQVLGRMHIVRRQPAELRVRLLGQL
jgi:hypothetical protein